MSTMPEKAPEAPSEKVASPKRFMLLWFAIPILLMIVIAFLK